MVVEVNEGIMLRLGLNQLGYSEFHRDRVRDETNRYRFVAAFGVSPLICSMVFHDIQVHIADGATATINNPKPLLLLMSFYWLYRYPVEAMTAAFFQLDEDTVRKWVWKYCKAIQALRPHKIKWYENLQNNNEDMIPTWLLSVDGTHCRINECRKVPDKDLYSHKHHKPCLSYEIGIDLFESKIVWVSGPHKGGETDLVIFRKELQDKIPNNKKAIGDDGYRNAPKVSIPNSYDSKAVNIFKRRARARHENLNSYLKNFEILNQRFRHHMDKHKIAFEAVCVLVQYSLENGHPLYQV